jgi:hypothetical protein
VKNTIALTIYNGVNDDAAGTTAVIYNYFKKLNKKTKEP